jgi:hypothetical protein
MDGQLQDLHSDYIRANITSSINHNSATRDQAQTVLSVWQDCANVLQLRFAGNSGVY